MQIQVNTDGNILGRERLADHVRGVVESVLGRLGHQITRVEVHLSDQHGGKSGHDEMRCMIEARLAGRQPTAVTHSAQTLDQAIDGAADKLKRSLDNTLERLHHRQQRDAE
jgi:ribosome-associated translation inhibitor RaiA